MKSINEYLISHKFKKKINVSRSNDDTFVDMGLPSGTIWRKFNLGAEDETEDGDYFAWGELEPKSAYKWKNYSMCFYGDERRLLKYCTNKSLSDNKNKIDNLTELEKQDDACYFTNKKWQIPTKEQCEELIKNVNINATRLKDKNGNTTSVFGIVCESKINGETLFFPNAGYKHGTALCDTLFDKAYITTSTLNDANPRNMYVLQFNGINAKLLDSFERSVGFQIRPVMVK